MPFRLAQQQMILNGRFVVHQSALHAICVISAISVVADVLDT